MASARALSPANPNAIRDGIVAAFQMSAKAARPKASNPDPMPPRERENSRATRRKRTSTERRMRIATRLSDVAGCGRRLP